MKFKLWLESEYTRDAFLHSDMKWDHPDIEDRRKAADTFIKGDYLDYLKPHEKENVKLINLPKNKRIVVSAYREPPIPMPIKNLDVQQDNWKEENQSEDYGTHSEMIGLVSQKVICPPNCSCSSMK